LVKVYLALAFLSPICLVVAYRLLALNPIVIAVTTLSLAALIYQQLNKFNRSREKQGVRSSVTYPSPPKTAEFLIYIIAPNKAIEPMLGDLHEEFLEISCKHGLRFARFWYWKQVLSSIIPIIHARITITITGKKRAWRIRD